MIAGRQTQHAALHINQSDACYNIYKPNIFCNDGMFRLCVVKVFRADEATENAAASERPSFVQYAHSCADHECHTPCDGVLVLDESPSRDLVTWSRNRSSVRNTTESWWWKEDTLTRFMLSECAKMSIAEGSNLVDALDISCTDIRNRQFLPKYEPRVPVQEETFTPCVQHIILTLANDEQKVHLFVCHATTNEGEHNLEKSCAACGVERSEECVLFLQFVSHFVDASQYQEKCVLFAGELPGIRSDDGHTESQEVWCLCQWSNLKHVIANTLSPQKNSNVCKYSYSLHITI